MRLTSMRRPGMVAVVLAGLLLASVGIAMAASQLTDTRSTTSPGSAAGAAPAQQPVTTPAPVQPQARVASRDVVDEDGHQVPFVG